MFEFAMKIFGCVKTALNFINTFIAAIIIAWRCMPKGTRVTEYAKSVALLTYFMSFKATNV